MIRHLLSLTALAAALSSTVAVAADLGGSLKDEPYIAPAAFTWTGFYAGANAGYGWSSEDWSLLQCNCAGMGGAGMGDPVPSHHADGGLGGGQIGYNYQLNSFVLGIEGEFDWTGMTGESHWSSNGQPHTVSTDINWIATLGARAGYAFDKSLIYVKGGGAWADTDYGHTHDMGAGMIHSLSGDATRSGWFIGGGFEHVLWQNVTGKIEYEYIDFGSEAVTLSDAGGHSATFDVDQNANVLKAGINYKF